MKIKLRAAHCPYTGERRRVETLPIGWQWVTPNAKASALFLTQSRQAFAAVEKPAVSPALDR